MTIIIIIHSNQENESTLTWKKKSRLKHFEFLNSGRVLRGGWSYYWCYFTNAKYSWDTWGIRYSWRLPVVPCVLCPSLLDQIHGTHQVNEPALDTFYSQSLCNSLSALVLTATTSNGKADVEKWEVGHMNISSHKIQVIWSFPLNRTLSKLHY